MILQSALSVMKKLLTTILFISYFIASTGATIRTHYCMGKVVEIGFNKKADDEKCPGCGMKDKKGCCSDKETRIKISDDQQQSITHIQISSLEIRLFQACIIDECFISHNLSSIPFLRKDPHNRKTLSLHIYNCAFLV